MRSLALLGLVLTLGVAACGGGSEQKPVSASGMPIAGGGLSVSEALASDLDGPLLVKGYVVVAGGETRLCEALAESFPPQCGGASVRLEGLDLAGLREQGGVRWSADPVSLLGEVAGGTLTVSVNAR
ncbi:MAG: hypothetical protein Q7S03_03030 [bacterium]|nr:hypothetical protein [bacterium]